MGKIVQWLTAGAVFVAGVGYGLIRFFKNDKTYSNLDHVEIPIEWEMMKYLAWAKASNVLRINGLKGITQCNNIEIQAGEELNPKSGQWGRKTTMNGKPFWYAGRATTKKIEIVGTPDKKPYSKSQGIFTHEVAETILDQNPEWAYKTVDQRNQFLWGLGL